MPVYSFVCEPCKKKEDFLRTVEERNKATSCRCGNKMKRVPERFNAEVFEEYFDEGLNSDVYSKRHKKAIMEQQGVIEAGDPVHGGRNFDSKMPNLIGKQRPKGKVWNPPKERSDAEVTTLNSKGEVTGVHKVDDLPDAGEGLK